MSKEKLPPGRPFKTFGVRLNDSLETPIATEMKQKITKYCQETELSVSEFVRRAIDNYIVHLKIKF
jgi:hypothetical protein